MQRIFGGARWIFEKVLVKLHIEVHHTHSLLRRTRTALAPLNVRDAVVAEENGQGGRMGGLAGRLGRLGTWGGWPGRLAGRVFWLAGAGGWQGGLVRVVRGGFFSSERKDVGLT